MSMKQFIEDLVTQITEYMTEYKYKTYSDLDIHEFAVFYMEEGEENYNVQTLHKIVRAVRAKLSKLKPAHFICDNPVRNESASKVEAGHYELNGFTILKDYCGYEWMVYETGNDHAPVRWFDTKREAVSYLNCLSNSQSYKQTLSVGNYNPHIPSESK